MASTCASSLSLMDAGVPITEHVAGIAMGLVIKDSKYRILTDIQGAEDHLGDMDFKICVTRQGITAIQLDNKVAGLSLEILADALETGQKAANQILDLMYQTIDKPRANLSLYAPKVAILHIAPEKIGDVIGPAGKIIKKIITHRYRRYNW